MNYLQQMVINKNLYFERFVSKCLFLLKLLEIVFSGERGDNIISI